MVSPSSLDNDDAGEDDDGELEIDGWDGKASLLKLVDASDNLRPSVPVEFSSQVIPTPPLPPHPHLHILPHPAPPCPALPFPAPPHLTPR